MKHLRQLSLSIALLMTPASAALADNDSLLAKTSHQRSEQSAIFPFSSMSADELNKCGLAKLDATEQVALLDWIRGRDMSLKTPTTSTIQQIVDNGKTIILKNGQSFTVTSNNRKKTARWTENTALEIFETTKYNSFVLQNNATGDTIKVKLVQPKKSK